MTLPEPGPEIVWGPADGPVRLPGPVHDWDPLATQSVDRRVLHGGHEVLHRVDPIYPAGVTGLGLQRCFATISIDPTGLPLAVGVKNCDERLYAPTRLALLQWRFAAKEPPTTTETTVAITFRE